MVKMILMNDHDHDHDGDSNKSVWINILHSASASKCLFDAFKNYDEAGNQVLVKTIKPYTRIKIPSIAAELNIPEVRKQGEASKKDEGRSRNGRKEDGMGDGRKEVVFDLCAVGRGGSSCIAHPRSKDHCED
eukprot:746667-Hanusia_phi.AAC.1